MLTTEMQSIAVALTGTNNVHNGYEFEIVSSSTNFFKYHGVDIW